MPRTTNIVQVFVASPSDLRPEREALESLIVELNRNWSTSLGILFELVRWETHTYPAFGADPQAIVNEQIGDSYDVFIGILWGRFGTPTPRALSGTVEEFERALERLRTQVPPPNVMVYFKDTPISPSKLDPEQLRLITEFRKSIAARGGLYSVFEDMPGFQSSLRAHLALLAQKYSDRTSHMMGVSETSDSKIVENDKDIDDLGYVDYLDLFGGRIAATNTALNVIGEATARIGKQVEQRTAEFERLAMSGVDVATARKAIKLVAGDMDAYAEVLKAQIPLMATSRDSAMDALASALELGSEFKNDNGDLLNLHNEIDNIVNIASTSNKHLRSFRSTVGSLPRATSDLNRAKRAVIEQLDLLISEVDKTVQNLQNIQASLDLMIRA